MFKASDGAELSGRLFGQGDVGIVLSHMADHANDQTDWFWFAGLLADRGYRVLTYDRRGVCPGDLGGCSVGNDAYADHWKDVVGAVATLRTEGARRVVVIGASLGAADCLRAAEERDSGIDGLVWIAGSTSDFVESEVANISIPVLVMAASGDPYGLFVDARTLDRWLTTSKGLVFPDSHLHGTDMLLPQADPVVSAGVLDDILTFVKSIG
jgi:pimeloyl-ACP methyl ester carboxylesterase